MPYREVFDHISESRTHNIADELAFKITKINN